MKEKTIGRTFTKRKKLIMILTPICSLFLAGVVLLTALWFKKSNEKITIDSGNTSVIEKPSDKDNLFGNTDKTDDKTNDKTDDKPNEGNTGSNGDKEQTPPVSGNAMLFYDPLKNMDLLHTFGFYYNSTLNTYHNHHGIDISATAGDEVYATTDGTISAIYTGDVLMGNSVSLDNGNGIVTVYYYIDPSESLTVGTKVSRGDVIGLVSSPTGSEYKDGAHLHVEVFENGKLSDPENYLSATEK